MTKIKRKYTPRAWKMLAVGDALADFIEQQGGGDVKKRMDLWANWRKIMGPGVASLGAPIEAKNGTLTIGADNNMAMQELNMQAPYILDRANAFLGEKTFKKIHFSLLQGRKALTGRPENRQDRFKPASAPPLPPQGFGQPKNRLDPESPIGKYYKAVHELYFPPTDK